MEISNLKILADYSHDTDPRFRMIRIDGVGTASLQIIVKLEQDGKDLRGGAFWLIAHADAEKEWCDLAASASTYSTGAGDLPRDRYIEIVDMIPEAIRNNSHIQREAERLARAAFRGSADD